MAYVVGQEVLDDLLRALCTGRQVYALEPLQDGYRLISGEGWDPASMSLGAYRPVEPLKSLFFRPREDVSAGTAPESPEEVPERIILGVKNCDLSALRIHDYVFRDLAPADPFYGALRERTVLVTCDCTDARETCFCPAVGEQPYPGEGYDINLSPVEEVYVVEAGSERGEAMLEAATDLLRHAGETVIQRRDEARAAMTEKVAELAAHKGLTPDMPLREAVAGSVDSELWDEFAEDCVECGACNFVCCTCHCFLLADGRSADGDATRRKQWDSCLFRNFARVAGGGNPREHRAERLHNRFDKKFCFFPEVLGIYACDGCGRCIEACTGKIDIRDVLKRAVDEC